MKTIKLLFSAVLLYAGSQLMADDLCLSPGQACVCSNTLRPGFCIYGPVKKGLYCHC